MKLFNDIEGYFDFPYIYTPIADQAKDGAVIVEVGSWLGKSMAFMAQRLQARGWKGRLVAIDGFTGELNQPDHAEVIAAHGGSILGAFEQNMRDCGIDDMVDVIVGDSAASADRFEDGSVDFCFIDAAHDYESVRRDICAWLPKIRPGGVIAGHDYPWPEVQRAVLEFLAPVGYQVYGACWYRNTAPDTSPEKIREYLVVAADEASRIKNLAHVKP